MSLYYLEIGKYCGIFTNEKEIQTAIKTLKKEELDSEVSIVIGEPPYTHDGFIPIDVQWGKNEPRTTYWAAPFDMGNVFYTADGYCGNGFCFDDYLNKEDE